MKKIKIITSLFKVLMKFTIRMTSTVLITGGSLGIGYELAKQFAADGLVLVAKPEKELAIAKKELKMF